VCGGLPELEYLGLKILAAGLMPFPSHLATIQAFPCPSLIKELQGFLGMVNFYRRFLSSIACTLWPITDELGGGKKGSEQLEWSAAIEATFAAAKQAMMSAAHLVSSTGLWGTTVGAALSLVVNALATHVYACLQQQPCGRKDWQPQGFFSKKLQAAQQKYSTSDRELFACYSGIRHF
jgi:hypothetical protein